jgi:hypothetical protein
VAENSLLERVTTAAVERHLSENTLIAYRRAWLKLIAWVAAEGLGIEMLPLERAGEFYDDATRGRSASHHLQVKAALALLYDILDSTNPFAECVAPNSRPRKSSGVITPPPNWGSSCANCARIAAATFGI